MAKKRQNEFATGVWVLGVFALMVASLIYIGGLRVGQSVRAYTVRFPASYALPDEIEAGAAVFCGATQVGTITGVRLRRDAPADEKGGASAGKAAALWVLFDFTVDEVVELREDCAIVARGPLLGGTGKLNITDPGAGGKVLAEGAVIDGAPTGSFEAALEMLQAEVNPANPAGLLAVIKSQLDPAMAESIIAKVHVSLDDIGVVTKGLARHMDQHEQDTIFAKIASILENLNQATADVREQLAARGPASAVVKLHGILDVLNHSLEQVDGILADNRKDIRSSIAGVERTLNTIEHGIAQPIADELSMRNTESLLNELHQSFARVNTLLADLEVVTDRTRGVVELNAERINHLLQNVLETSLHLKTASKDLRRNPWRLFYRPTLEETKQLHIFDAAREFSEASSRLEQTAGDLRSLLERDGGRATDDVDLQRIKERLEKMFDEYTKAEQALWSELYEGE